MKKILGIHQSALLEIVSLLAFLTAASYFFGDGSRFLGIQPHPFWIVILLMIVQYGTIEALAATFFATLFLYAGNIPPQMVEESTFSYQFRLSFTPFLWFSASFIFGELRMRVQTRLDEALKKRDEALSHATTITENYEMLKVMKDNIEARLAGQVHTVASTYESVKELESLEPVQIIMRLDTVVKSALNPEKFSVYAFGPNGLEATTSVGWAPEDNFSRRFTEEDSLYQEIVVNQRLVSVINKEDKEILKGEGVMAAPLLNGNNGSVFGMLKIEEIDFFRLDVGNLETFSTLCYLIGSAYSNAVQYTGAMKNTIFDTSDGLFSSRLYKITKSWAEAFAKRTSTPLTNLSIQLTPPEDRSDDDWVRDSKIFYDLMTENLPTKKDTPVFQSVGKSKRFEIILPLTTVEQSEKLSLKLLKVFQQNLALAPYHFHFESKGIVAPKEDEAGSRAKNI